MAPTPGTRLGPYEVVALLGAGGMGEVHRARDTKLNRDVAIKVLPDLFVSDPERLARFQREAQVLASLNHQNIAHIRWLAYYSTESGQAQVSVRPFPDVQGGRWQISTAGGSRPAWATSGKELFFLDANNAVMAVRVQTTPSFKADNPSKLFDGPWYAGQSGRTYDVSRDGRRFLMIKPSAVGQGSGSPDINVVLNWTEELKARVAAK